MAKDLQKDLQELLTGGFLKVVKDNRGEYKGYAAVLPC